ncbi:MAG: HDIG domain-containing protein [Treponemataceae bacterium]
MTKNRKDIKIQTTRNSLEKIGDSIKQNSIFYALSAVSFAVLMLATYFTFLSDRSFSATKLANFAVGKFAEHDVSANRDLTYINEEATALKRQERKAELLPVFINDTQITSKVLGDVNAFTDGFNRMDTFKSAYEFVNAVIEKFPTKFSAADFTILTPMFEKNFEEKIQIVSILARQIMDLGIIKIPDIDLSEYKQGEIELITKVENTQQYSTIKLNHFITIDKLHGYVENILRGMGKQDLTNDVVLILKRFLAENIIFDAGETERRLQSAMAEVVPVTVVVPAGEVIIRQGFIVTDEAYQKLQRLSQQSYSFDRKLIVGWSLFFIIVFLLTLFLFSSKILGTALSLKNQLILLASVDLVYLIVLWLSKLKIIPTHLELMSVMPVTVFVMLSAILISKKVAVLHAVVMSLMILIPVDLNFPIALYVLFSSLAGIAFIHISDKRIDLIKTALELTFINPLLAFSVITLFGEQAPMLKIMFGTAINGFMTGIFILGFLPILESAFNIPTDFRLMELSDLNSSVMKKMLLTVPGTYNHSILVASLAEAACRAIGANPLLARVGAYYHDIGKMENPQYFVENQTGENKHTELNPRLSATIIRSHTKLGIAQGHDLHLPEEVIDIIATHHGNGLISFFYHKALEAEGENISKADFSYPGPRPHGKEASVVMLADIVEAACRAKIAKEKVSDLKGFFEKTIDILVKSKIDADQLSDSLLSFGEIAIVKKTFVEILYGYYHSRIDYPSDKKTEGKNSDDSDSAQTAEKPKEEIQPSEQPSKNASVKNSPEKGSSTAEKKDETAAKAGTKPVAKKTTKKKVQEDAE